MSSQARTAGETFRLASPWLTLIFLVAGILLSSLGVIGWTLGWYGVSEEVEPELQERLFSSASVLALVSALLAVYLSVSLGLSLVQEVRVSRDGALGFRTPLRTLTLAADEPVEVDRLLALMWVRLPAGRVFLLPELAREEPLLALIEAHPPPRSAPGDPGAPGVQTAPVPMPRGLLDTSLRRIVFTDSFSFRLASFGMMAAALLPVAFVLIFIFVDDAAVEPDGSVRPVAQHILFATICTLIPLATMAPFVASRVFRWRAILERGEPRPGRIDDVGGSGDDLLVRCSFEQSGRTHRIRLLVRPTRQAKALRAGAPEILLVLPEQPRRALPQSLFLGRRDATEAHGVDEEWTDVLDR